MKTRVRSFAPLMAITIPLFTVPLGAAPPGEPASSTWPQEYAVQRDAAAGLLTLSTPYYTVRHDLKRGGAIASIRLTYGRSTNLLMQPIATQVRDDRGHRFTDLNDPAPRVVHRQDGLKELVTVESELRDEKGGPSGIRARTVFEYRWGYLKIHREISVTNDAFRAREVSPVSTVLAPNLSHYGYREGITESEGAPPFSFGSCRWGTLRPGDPSDRPVKTPYVPRYLMLADPGVEGLEWFVGSDLSQWELQLTGRRGQGQCLVQADADPPGIAVSVSPYFSTTTNVSLPKVAAFDFHLGLPLLEGHALKPWIHTSFNRNRGNWVSTEEIRRWAEKGFQTVHCHNDGDYYEDGLFWRDGSYPPYPDMERYDKVIADCHDVGIRVATYFSNKELHPSTKEFQEHGTDWGRMDSKGRLQHNFYRGTNEFGAQMCLRSGWLEFLKFSIERVLRNHPLDGVYYDWNVALFCRNGGHEGRKAGEIGTGHWDIDELLDLMEWTRRRVGPEGLVIVHNTTTPMFATENFADDVVANEWGYGRWKDPGPALAELPLEWSLVGARARGVISYGQLDAQSPRRLHRVFALEALVSGVTPWPASPETFELFAILKPLANLESYRFLDWRNRVLTLEGDRCASAIYSRPGEAYAVLANLDQSPREIRCVLRPERLPHPLAKPFTATRVNALAGTTQERDKTGAVELNADQLTGAGVKIAIPADNAVLLHVR